jgi:hypothetical protein
VKRWSKKVVNGEDDHENAIFRRMNLPPDAKIPLVESPDAKIPLVEALYAEAAVGVSVTW